MAARDLAVLEVEGQSGLSHVDEVEVGAVLREEELLLVLVEPVSLQPTVDAVVTLISCVIKTLWPNRRNGQLMRKCDFGWKN